MSWFNEVSISGQKADAVFLYVFGLAVVFLVLITGLMIYFVIRYSRKRHPRAAQIEGHQSMWFPAAPIPPGFRPPSSGPMTSSAR